jgi:hypothetical protein
MIIALMTEAVCASETSVHFNVTTWRYVPEDSKLHSDVVNIIMEVVGRDGSCQENPEMWGKHSSLQYEM